MAEQFSYWGFGFGSRWPYGGKAIRNSCLETVLYLGHRQVALLTQTHGEVRRYVNQ